MARPLQKDRRSIALFIRFISNRVIRENGGEKINSVNIDAKELKAKTYYSSMLLFFGISAMIYLIVGFIGLSGIIKWILYSASIFFAFLGILFFTKDVSYCKSCDEAYDFDFTECPICGNKLELKSKSTINHLRRNSAQEEPKTREKIVTEEKKPVAAPLIKSDENEDKKVRSETSTFEKREPTKASGQSIQTPALEETQRRKIRDLIIQALEDEEIKRKIKDIIIQALEDEETQRKIKNANIQALEDELVIR